MKDICQISLLPGANVGAIVGSELGFVGSKDGVIVGLREIEGRVVGLEDGRSVGLGEEEGKAVVGVKPIITFLKFKKFKVPKPVTASHPLAQ